MDTEQKKPNESANPAGVRERVREEQRKRRAGSGRKSTGGTRTASPTRGIEPGLVHQKIAEGILTGIHNRTGLDVGQFPETDGVAGTDQDDPERLVNIVSHMVARTFDRITPLRKLSRHMEGADKRSGFLSDAFAVAVEMYRRNPDRLQEIASEYAREFQEKRATKQAAENGKVRGVTPTVGAT